MLYICIYILNIFAKDIIGAGSKHETFVSHSIEKFTKQNLKYLSFLKRFGYETLIGFRETKRYKTFVSDTKLFYQIQSFSIRYVKSFSIRNKTFLSDFLAKDNNVFCPNHVKTQKMIYLFKKFCINTKNKLSYCRDIEWIRNKT